MDTSKIAMAITADIADQIKDLPWQEVKAVCEKHSLAATNELLKVKLPLKKVPWSISEEAIRIAKEEAEQEQMSEQMWVDKLIKTYKLETKIVKR